jgi:hypothetical protein
MKFISQEWVIWLLLTAAVFFFIGIFTGNELLLIPLALLIIVVGVFEWWHKA